MADKKPAMPKVTYATLAAGQTPEFSKAYDEALEAVRGNFGKTHPNLIGGREVTASETFQDTSPSDTRIVLGKFQSGTREDARAAIDVARKAYETTWRDMPWRERVAYVRKIAAAIEKRRFELSALMSIEVGKNRLEAMGDGRSGVRTTFPAIRAAAVRMSSRVIPGSDNRLPHRRAPRPIWPAWSLPATFGFRSDPP